MAEPLMLTWMQGNKGEWVVIQESLITAKRERRWDKAGENIFIIEKKEVV